MQGVVRMTLTSTPRRCTLSAWTTNSIIVHATSASIGGPFLFKGVVQPAWSRAANSEGAGGPPGPFYRLFQWIQTRFPLNLHGI
jgi:hypothetical protein